MERSKKRSLAQTPAPTKDKIYGSKVNKKGSASSESNAESIKLSDAIVSVLEGKMEEHNAEYPNRKVTLAILKAVFRRGAGAYSRSHRPTISGGKPNSRTAWAYARVNKFLEKKAGKQVKKAYVQDDDLIGKYAKGGEVNLNFYDTTPEHAKKYGFDSKSPMFVQNVCLSNKREIKNLEKHAKSNNHDLIFGHIAEKSEPNVKVIKDMLEKAGFTTIEGNNDFYKYVDTDNFELGGEIESGVKVYHGSSRKFENFDRSKLGEATKSKSATFGFFFTDDIETAKSYSRAENWRKVQELLDAGKQREAERLENLIFADKDPSYLYEKRLFFKNPLVVDADGAMYNDFSDEINDSIAVAIKNGNDVLIIKNLSDNADYSEYTPATHFLVFDESIIKDGSTKKYHLGGDMSKHLAPNGKPSNLNHEQWHLVRTPEFKAWFGDWENDPENASKVVDENGEPMVVYHGTKEYFTEFKKENQNLATGFGDFGAGFYFTSSYDTAKYYTLKFEKRTIFSVFLKTLNPFVIELNWEKFSVNTIQNYEKLKGLYDWQRNAINSVLIDKNDYRPSKTITKAIGDFSFQDLLIRNGFDGVFVNRFNIYEVEDANHISQILPLNEIVVFEPEQIKLADGSNTTFDVSNPDIRFADGGDVVLDNLALKDETPILETPLILSSDGLPDLDIVPSKEAYEALEANIGGDKGIVDDKIRTIPIQEYDVYSNKRSRQIAEQIEENGWIEPLIVSYDKNGDVYIVEGQHRASALQELGYDKAPVIVIHEKGYGQQKREEIRFEDGGEIGFDLMGLPYSLRYPSKNTVVYVDPKKVLDYHKSTEPDFSVIDPKNRIGNRVQRAESFITDYAKDRRWIDVKTGERTKYEVSFEPSIAMLSNGKLSFEDGRHRILSAYNLGAKAVALEVPKSQKQQFTDLFGIKESFADGGQMSKKKAYVSIRMPFDVDRNKSLDYVYTYDNKVFEELNSGTLDGVIGVSSSPNNVAEWFVSRDCLIVMDYAEFEKMNNTEVIDYDNPYQLLKDEAKLFKRLYNNLNKIEENDKRTLQQTYTKIGEKFGQEIRLALKVSDGQKYQELARIERFLNPYNTSAFYRNLTDKGIIIESPEDFTREILDFNKIDDSYLGMGFENPVLSFDELLPIVKRGITNASKIYESEQEVVLLDRKLNIPKNSQLFIVKKQNENNIEDLIEQFKLRDRYKIYYVEQKNLERYRTKFFEKEQKRFDEKIKLGIAELEAKKDRVLPEILDYFIDYSLGSAYKIQSAEYGDELFYDRNSDDYEEYTWVNIPFVVDILTTYKQIVRESWNEQFSGKSVKDINIYSFMAFQDNAKRNLTTYFDRNNEYFQSFNFRGNNIGGFSEYSLKYDLEKSLNDYSNSPEWLDYKELAKKYLLNMGSDIYRYFKEDEVVLTSKYAKGGISILPEIEISHSFTNKKGNKVVQYKLTGGYGGYARVEHSPDGFVINNIILDDRIRGKGLATEFYKRINDESIQATGKTLQSTNPDSTGLIELSEDGQKLWESLVKKGLAKKIMDKRYRFLPNKLSMAKGGEIKDLIVLHNINSYQIEEANKLGGLVTPSIAIVKAGNSFTDFGSITLIGTKELIDPENRSVKVFAGDVYSPSVPTKLYYVDKKLLDKVTTALINKAYTYGEKIGDSDREIYSLVQRIIGDYSDFGKDLNKMTLDELIRQYYDKLKLVYIVDKSIKIKVPMKDKRQFLWNNFEFTLTPEQKKRFAPILRKYTEERNEKGSLGISKEIKDKVYDLLLEVKDDYKLSIKDKYKDRENSEAIYKLYTDGIDESFEKYVGKRDDWSASAEHNLSRAVYGEKVLDEDRLKQNIKKVFSKQVSQDYEKWLSDFITQFRGSAYFLKGNQKMPYTLNDLVDATSSRIVGQETNMTFGVNQAKSYGTKRFNSIADIKKNSGKLISKEEMNVIDEANKDNFFRLSEMLNYKGGTWDKLDSLGRALADYFKGSSASTALSRNDFKSPSSSSITLFEDFANELKNSPVDYFEAKYRRAVSLSEFKYAIVPKDTSKTVIEILNKNGLIVRKYANNEQRLELINNISSKDKSIKFAKGGYFHLGGDMSKHLAPNGERSKLTHKQWHLVRTPEFKAWFGDWENDPENASKVVDENGEPMVVYHGTNAETFVVFDGGSFFTDDYMNADGYASGEMVYEVFLNIKKPLIINARGRKWDNLKNKYGNSTRDIVGQLDMDKYDGVIFNNINDNWFDDEMGDTQNVYFSINPEQIKLANGSNTTFDGSNPDIRFEKGGKILYHGSPYNFDEFKLSQIGTGEGVQAFGWGLYFTDLEDIARNYAVDLAQYDILIDGKPHYESSLWQLATILAYNPKSWVNMSKEEIENEIKNDTSIDKLTKQEVLSDIKKAKSIKVVANRNLYKVSLHKDKAPDEFTWLEWDKPISEEQKNLIFEQSKRESLKDKYITEFGIERVKISPDKIVNTRYSIQLDGVNLYGKLKDYFESDKEASLFLLRAGIDGIKFPAESLARGTTSDTARGFNYVVFDDDFVKIEDKQQFKKGGSLLDTKIEKTPLKGKTLADVYDLPELYELAEKYKMGLGTIRKEYLKGIEVEREHTNDYGLSAQIALNHLNEDSKYYTKLKKLKLKRGGKMVVNGAVRPFINLND